MSPRPDDRAGQRRPLGAERDFLDERLGDLEDVDREPLEIAERRVAGAEVVDREPHAQLLELLESLQHGVGLLHQHALGDLQDHRGGIHARAGERGAQRVGDPGALELASRDVDRDGQRRLRVRLAPGVHLAAGLLQHPAPQLHDEPGLLRQRDEVLGQEVAVGLVLPSHQRLDPVDQRRCRAARSAGSGASARRHRSRRAARLPSPAAAARRRTSATRRSPSGPCPCAWRRTSPRRRSEAGRPPTRPRPRWRRRCWRVTCTWFPLSVKGWPMAVASRSSSSARPSGPAECSSRMANSSPPRRATVSAARAQERNRSAAAMRSRSPSAWPRLSFTRLKSSRSRKRTVIGFDWPLSQRERVAHPVAEERAVGEAGERIVERLVGELLLQPLALAHVAGVEHDAADGRIAGEVRGQDLGAEPASRPAGGSATRPGR